MTNYRNGADFERAVKADLEADGYWVIRAAGSKGKIDVLAIKPGQMLAIQVKRNGKVDPGERRDVLDIAGHIDALPIIAFKVRGHLKPLYDRLTGPNHKDRIPFQTDELAGDPEHGE